MTLRFQYCTESNKTSQNLDTMLFIVLENNDKEIFRVPLYLAADAIDLMPELKKSFENLPNLIKTIYNSGINNEKVEFKEETVTID